MNARKALIISVILGLFLWEVDAIIGYLVLNQGTFLDSMLFNLGPYELYRRCLTLVSFVVFGMLISAIVSRLTVAEARTEHLNMVLRAIRGINQLITKEKDRDTLIQTACDKLTTACRHNGAWLAVFDSAGNVVTTAETGFGEAFLPLAARMQDGELPDATREAMTTHDIVVSKNALSMTSDRTPSARASSTAAMTCRLEHDGSVLGVICIATSGDLATDREEHALLEEAAMDVAFALYGIELEAQQRRAEEVRHAQYEIAKALNATEELFDLFRKIQLELGRVMNTENFSIALYDKDSGDISVPYLVDAREGSGAEARLRSLHEYVVHNDTSLLITPSEIERWNEDGVIQFSGAPPALWLGAPLRARGEVVGAMALHSYDDDKAFGEQDLEVLNFVSGQIGLSIERRRAEERLQFLGSIPLQVSDAIVVTNLAFKITYVNKATERLYGYTMEELLGKSPSVLKANADGESVPKAVYERVSVGDVWSGSSLQVRKDGSTFICEMSVSPLRDPQGQITSYITVQRDITERHRAEKLLQTLNRAALAMETATSPEETYAAVAAALSKIALHSTIFMLDETGDIALPEYSSLGADVVEAAESLAGLDMMQIPVAVDSVEVFRTAVRERKSTYVDNLGGLLCELLPESSRWSAEEAARAMEGRKAVVAPLTTGDRVIGVLMVQSGDLVRNDVPAVTAYANQLAASWRKARLMGRLERSVCELKKAQDQLVLGQKMEAVGRLAGGVAHDFNNRLTAITGYSDLLLRRLQGDDPNREDIEQIRKAAEQAAGLTRQLLAFSRKQPLQKRMVDVNSVVTDMDKMFRRLSGDHIEFVVNLDPGLGAVVADPSQIEQVILNLVVNASDAMHDGGRLTINTENVVVDDGIASITPGAYPGRYVRVSVQDSGVGIDRDVIDRIFEPFFTTKEIGKGTGLGLSVVYGIVSQHGGWVNVYSEPGHGTTFKVYLPIARRSQEQMAAVDDVAKQEAPRGSGEKILLVEDEETVRNFAKKALRENGYVVQEVGSVEEALNAFEGQNQEFDLIFSDVVLPDKSGVQLIEELLTRKPGIRVLLSSGYTNLQEEWENITQKGYPFLQKPYPLSDLLRMLREVIDGDGVTHVSEPPPGMAPEGQLPT